MSRSTTLVLVLLLTTLSTTCEAFTFLPKPISTTFTQHTSTYNKRHSLTILSMNPDKDEDDEDEDDPAQIQINVLGTYLTPCCENVRGTGVATGWYRNGYCATGEDDMGLHTVCVECTEEFLDYSEEVGNDLSTPEPYYQFPGLEPGDIWCLCASRFAQAYFADKAPRVFLQATHEKTLDYVPLEALMKNAVDQEEGEKTLKRLNEARDEIRKMLNE